MNQMNFNMIQVDKRVKLVNELLKKEGFKLEDVAKKIGINYSTFTKLMQDDDYVYIKRENQYYKFIREPSQNRSHIKHTDDELEYLKEHFETLKKVIEKYDSNIEFTIDMRLFKSTSKISTKNFRISEELYKEFTNVCESTLPHLKIQDIIAQLILSFLDSHSIRV